MIAIALLALMGVAIFQVTTQSFRVNFSLNQESTDRIATALSIQSLEADLSQIYNPVLEAPKKAVPAAPNGTQIQAPVAPTLGQETQEQPSEFWSIPVRADGLRRTRLKGTGEKLTFVANNNRRVEEDSPQSDFQKITWEVERNSEGSYTLYRTTDWDVFETEDSKAKKPARVALLENLSSAKFRYYRFANTTWEDSWDSENPYVLPQDRFPDLISLKVELPDPTNHTVPQSWEITVKPNMRLSAERPKGGPTASQPQEPTR
jgi:hypothetical protein